MKLLAAIILLVVSEARATSAQNIESSPDTKVLIAVLEQAVIPDVIVYWALDPKVDGPVLSTETVGCALPIEADERLRQNPRERAAASEKVPPPKRGSSSIAQPVRGLRGRGSAQAPSMDVGERQDDSKCQNCPDEQDDKVHAHECQDPFSERSGA